MGREPVLNQIDRYASGAVTYRELRTWIAEHVPPEPDPVSSAYAARYRKLCGADLPTQGDVGRQLSDAEVEGLLTEQEAADLYDAWCNP